MSKRTGWDRRLSVADGKGLVGHAGAVLLRACADRVGLTGALARVLPAGTGSWRDRAEVVVDLACAIVLGAVNLSDAEQLQAHQGPVFGPPASDSTARRTLAGMDEALSGRIARAHARVRRHVWALLDLRPGGFPWLVVAASGWPAGSSSTSMPRSSPPPRTRPEPRLRSQKTYGLSPLAAWCANTQEPLAMLLRPGNAGAHTVADHVRVRTDALAQIPDSSRAKILVRIDGAGATHELLAHLEARNTRRRTVRYTVGWTVTDADEQAIARLPDTAWHDALNPDGTVQDGSHVAELTGLNTRAGWPATLRLLVHRVRASRRQLKKLTDFDKRTGWRYSIVATTITRLSGVAGAHQPQWIDALARAHACVEDRLRTGKTMGLRTLPSQDWTVNRGWMLTANLAHDLDCWVRLLGRHDQPGLQRAEPDTMRSRLYHLPARLATHARRRWLRLERTWPWTAAFTVCRRRLTMLPATT